MRFDCCIPLRWMNGWRRKRLRWMARLVYNDICSRTVQCVKIESAISYVLQNLMSIGSGLRVHERFSWSGMSTIRSRAKVQAAD